MGTDGEAMATESPSFEVSLGDFTAKANRAKAQRRWRLLKNVRMAVRRTSLTKPESDLLEALSNKSKKVAPADADSQRASIDSFGISSDGAESVARGRLRRSICLCRDSITTTESNFLRELLEAEDVSDEALANTAEVLETDVIFKKGASRTLSSSSAMNSAASLLSPMASIPEAIERRQSQESQKQAQAASASASAATNTPKGEQREETFQQDMSYRKELWRTHQRSTIKDDDGCEASMDPTDQATQGKGKEGDVSNNDVEESPFISMFKKGFKDLADTIEISGRTADTEASSGSSDNDEEKEDVEHKKEELKPSAVPFSFLGMSPTDGNLTGLHVLTPPLIDTLRPHMPYAVQEDNFWLKYSLVQDGASIDVLLSKIRMSAHTILAIETIDGQVFGSFTASPWRQRGTSYYGSCEAFLWRMSRSRRTPSSSVLDRARLKSDVEAFRWTGDNRNIQLSNPRTLAVGGGEPDKVVEQRILFRAGDDDNNDRDFATATDGGTRDNGRAWDFGLALNADLSSGSSGRCATFGTTSGLYRGRDTFEVSNIEVWTLTPMTDVEQAEKLELGRQFVFSNVSAQASGIKPKTKNLMASRAA